MKIPQDSLTNNTASGSGLNDPSTNETADFTSRGNNSAELSNTASSQTVTFQDVDSVEKVEFNTPRDSVAINDGQSKLDLERFLARPTLIDSKTWGSGGLSNDGLYPWHKFLTNTYIENKIKNFGLIRGDLHVKFVISSSPFVYGCTSVSYVPLVTQVSEATKDNHTYGHCQRPHIFLMPQNSSGGEFVLPFFYHMNYLNLLDEDDVEAIGYFKFIELVALDTANDVTIPTLDIQIYAWMTDVHMEGATSQAILQGGSEYSMGPLERISSAVATIAGLGKEIPMIAPFALATEIGAAAVSSVASIFGWSKVPLIENAKPVVDTPYHGMASQEISGPIQKFTLDPKAETSVDPRIVNLNGRDELNISYLIMKQGYMSSQVWDSADSVGTQLMRFPVSPYNCPVSVTGDTVTMYHSPMSYVAFLFDKWRGDIIYTFKIVCSKFHRGRLKLSFDPFGATGAGSYENIVLTKIVDIADTNEVEFVVPYMQASTWSKLHRDVRELSFDEDDTTSDWVEGNNNGCLRVQVLSVLSSPQATPSVTILSYVRGAANLEYAQPRSLQIDPVTHLDLQSGSEDVESNKKHNQEYLVNFGENVVSLRQVLARSTLSQIIPSQSGSSADPAAGCRSTVMSRLPAPPGYDTKSYLESEVIATGSNAYYTFSYMHPINWVAPCFAAMRGSTQVKLVTSLDSSFGEKVYLDRYEQSLAANSAYTVGSNGYTYNPSENSQGTNEAAFSYHQHIPYGGGGIAIADEGGVLSAEVSSRTHCLFNTTRQENWLLGTSHDDSDRDLLVYNRYYIRGGSTYTPLCTSKYFNIGTDFNLHFFINVPVVYYNENLGAEKYVAE